MRSEVWFLGILLVLCQGGAVFAAEELSCERRVARQYSLPRSFGGDRLLSALIKKEGKRPAMEVRSAGYRIETAKGSWSLIFEDSGSKVRSFYTVKYVSESGETPPKGCPLKVKSFSEAFQCLKGRPQLDSENSVYFLADGGMVSVYRAQGRRIAKLTLDTRFSCEFSVGGTDCECVNPFGGYVEK